MLPNGQRCKIVWHCGHGNQSRPTQYITGREMNPKSPSDLFHWQPPGQKKIASLSTLVLFRVVDAMHLILLHMNSKLMCWLKLCVTRTVVRLLQAITLCICALETLIKDDNFSFLWADSKPKEWGTAPSEDAILRLYISQGCSELKTVSELPCFVNILSS